MTFRPRRSNSFTRAVGAGAAMVFMAGVVSAFAMSGSGGTGFDVRAAAPGVGASADAGIQGFEELGAAAGHKTTARKSSPTTLGGVLGSVPAPSAAVGVTASPAPGVTVSTARRAVTPLLPSTSTLAPTIKPATAPKATVTPSGTLALPGLGVPALDGLLGTLDIVNVPVVTDLLNGLSPELL
ncbi:MAG: hypothetical protein ACRD0O_13620, partial [Acidimicrobiia bacterium]